jgi:hypothetical protein
VGKEEGVVVGQRGRKMVTEEWSMGDEALVKERSVTGRESTTFEWGFQKWHYTRPSLDTTLFRIPWFGKVQLRPNQQCSLGVYRLQMCCSESEACSVARWEYTTCRNPLERLSYRPGRTSTGPLGRVLYSTILPHGTKGTVDTSDITRDTDREHIHDTDTGIPSAYAIKWSVHTVIERAGTGNDQ